MRLSTLTSLIVPDEHLSGSSGLIRLAILIGLMRHYGALELLKIIFDEIFRRDVPS
jgi:hypothetical protein